MDNYQSIGFTKKTYGVKGELKLNIQDKYLEDLAQTEVLFLGIAGRKIPNFIEYINFENPFTIKFEDYNTKEAVIELTGKEIFMRKSDLLPVEEKMLIVEEDSLFYEKYTGFTIRDNLLGVLGKIKEVIAFPQQEMAVVLIKEKEVLIPLNEQLIVEIDEAKQLIVMELPEGIVDLN